MVVGIKGFYFAVTGLFALIEELTRHASLRWHRRTADEYENVYENVYENEDDKSHSLGSGGGAGESFCPSFTLK